MIETERLRLREWRDADLAPFADLCADPVVREHFPATLTPEQSAEWAGRIRQHFARHGYGLWAVERGNRAPFIGYLGLSVVGFEAHFTPAVEIGWGFARTAWGRGYASEAARAVLRHGFERLGLAEVVSFSVPANTRSWGLMKGIGMQRNPLEDFDHPALPEGHPLRRHVLYRLAADDWQRRAETSPH
jgi:RimJ/RimL family protein N-acetyltransferase